MMRLSETARLLDGTLEGEDREFAAVGIDSRVPAPGGLFVALKGPRFDGHDFLQQASAQGAVGALVQDLRAAPLPVVRVKDTHAALARLGAQWRSRFRIPVVAVTGSNGKTTVKTMLAEILSQGGPGTVTAGNLNNDIGVPLTLLRMKPGDHFAVIEMGMNHAGEITHLTALARPDVAMITNAGAAHLEGLGSIAAVARAKGEIFSGLAAGGIAVINHDDPHCALWRELAADHEIVTFGFSGGDVVGEASCDASGCAISISARLPRGRVDLVAQIKLLGRHNALNAVAAAAGALAAGADANQVVRGLGAMQPVPGRLEPRPGHAGARIINDTYNANPGSVAAAISVLQSLPGERVLVLGDMLELGSAADAQHAETGMAARAAGIEHLLAFGPLSVAAVKAFGGAGRHFDSIEALTEALLEIMHKDAVVLVKGSRSMRMERVVNGISSSPIAGHGDH